MAIYLYTDIPSNGARDLVAAIGATRLRKFDGMDFWRKKRKIVLNPGDFLICWGKLLPQLDGVKMLNAGKNQSKVDEMWALVNSGLPTVTTQTKGPQEGFVPRSKYHVGGNDLLSTPARPDFWVKKENLVKEYRIHSFNERSIRAGVKQPRDGFTIAPDVASFVMGRNAHPWIRSYDGGWRINYDEFQSTKDLRELAHKAVKALGLNFGAVDIGERADGSRIVLEVNRAPGLEGGTIEAYKRAIEKWMAGEGAKVEEKKPEAEKPAAPYVNPLEQREARYGRPRFPRADRVVDIEIPQPAAPQVQRWVANADGNLYPAPPDLQAPRPARIPVQPIRRAGGAPAVRPGNAGLRAAEERLRGQLDALGYPRVNRGI